MSEEEDDFAGQCVEGETPTGDECKCAEDGSMLCVEDDFQFGVETVDPTYTVCQNADAPDDDFQCRWSDSNFSEFQTAPPDPDPNEPGESPTEVKFRLGYIARTALNSVSESLILPEFSLAWDGVNNYKIIREASSWVGMRVYKVGRSTGKTEGEVTGVGLSERISEDGNPLIVLRDQAKARLYGQPGDSGGSVFRAYCHDQTRSVETLLTPRASRYCQ